jgi:hypothetical protein
MHVEIDSHPISQSSNLSELQIPLTEVNTDFNNDSDDNSCGSYWDVLWAKAQNWWSDRSNSKTSIMELDLNCNGLIDSKEDLEAFDKFYKARNIDNKLIGYNSEELRGVFKKMAISDYIDEDGNTNPNGKSDLFDVLFEDSIFQTTKVKDLTYKYPSLIPTDVGFIRPEEKYDYSLDLNIAEGFNLAFGDNSLRFYEYLESDIGLDSSPFYLPEHNGISTEVEIVDLISKNKDINPEFVDTIISELSLLDEYLGTALPFQEAKVVVSFPILNNDSSYTYVGGPLGDTSVTSIIMDNQILDDYKAFATELAQVRLSPNLLAHINNPEVIDALTLEQEVIANSFGLIVGCAKTGMSYEEYLHQSQYGRFVIGDTRYEYNSYLITSEQYEALREKLSDIYMFAPNSNN